MGCDVEEIELRDCAIAKLRDLVFLNDSALNPKFLALAFDLSYIEIAQFAISQSRNSAISPISQFPRLLAILLRALWNRHHFGDPSNEVYYSRTALRCHCGLQYW